MFETDWDWEPEQRRESPLPAELATVAPGARLGTLLETIDRSALNGYELVVLLQARARQIAHLQAEFYTDIREVVMSSPCDPDSPAERKPDIDEEGVDEIRVALSLTRTSAATQVVLAFDLERLPRAQEMLGRGLIDLPRARVMCHETAHVERDEAVRIVDSLAEQAPDLTTGQLGQRLRRRCAEADPDAARRRYEEGVGGRHLEGRQNPDGTADLCGRQLPVDRVAAIQHRINAMAQKIRGSDDRCLDQIRADLFLELLEGRHSGETQQRGTVEIRVDLTTLLGLDDCAGEIPGWGPVISDLARRVVERQPGSEWQVIVTDPETGVPVYSAITRRRPTAAQRRHVIARNPTCIFPTCRTRARSSQIDHTRDHALGGPTVVENLGPGCPHDHLTAKHKHGWRFSQPQPGVFEWTSPRSHQYTVRPPPD